MTTLNRIKSALLVIDVQNDVLGNAYKRNEVIANIKSIVEKARGNGVEVIWVQHSEEHMPIGSDGWQIVPELIPISSEQIVRKTFRSSFDETNLEEILAKGDIGKLFICGAETNFCIRSTSYGALERGYDITLISDSHTAWDGSGDDIPASVVIAEQNRSFDGYQLSGRRASIAKAKEVVFE